MKFLVTILLLATPAFAGHSRHPYFDGGQSPDGRFTVKPELVEEAAVGKQSSYHWKFTWTDTKTGTATTGKLEGLRSGKNGVFDPVHAHIFVPPGGETFAVWNPNVIAKTTNPNEKWPDLTSAEAKTWAGFANRLVVYKKSGEVVQRFDLKDFLQDGDWNWLFCYGRQIYWQASYPGLTRDNAPRVGYALYRISPDHTVLETLVGPTAEGASKSKDAPAPRSVRVDLLTGKFLDTSAKLPGEKTPVQPFVGSLTKRGGGQASYIPSLDPVRVEGKFP